MSTVENAHELVAVSGVYHVVVVKSRTRVKKSSKEKRRCRDCCQRKTTGVPYECPGHEKIQSKRPFAEESNPGALSEDPSEESKPAAF